MLARLPWRRLEEARCSGIALLTVEEGLSEPGCLVCRLVRKAEERAVLDVLREGLNDPRLREEVGESLGFCPYHAWMLVRVVEKHGIVDALGASILYEDMLSRLLKSLREGRGEHGRGECLLCKFAREFEKVYTGFFAELADSKNMDLASMYRNPSQYRA